MDKTMAARTKSKAQLNRAKNTLPPPRPRLVKSENQNERHLPHTAATATSTAYAGSSSETSADLKMKISSLQSHVANLSRNRHLVLEDLRDGWEAILKEIRATYKKVSTHM